MTTETAKPLVRQEIEVIVCRPELPPEFLPPLDDIGGPAVSTTYHSPVFDLQGFSSLVVGVIANNAFTVQLRAAIVDTGPFVQINPLVASIVDPVSGLQVVDATLIPMRRYGRIRIVVPAAVPLGANFDICIYALPIGCCGAILNGV